MQDHSASKHHKKMKGIKALGLCLFFVGIIAVSTAFIQYIWVKTLKETEKEAIQLAAAVESGIQKSYIANLVAEPEPFRLPEYHEIKDNLVKVVKLDNDIQFIRIYAQTGGELRTLVDSDTNSPEGFPSYPRLDAKTEQELLVPFQTGMEAVTKPVKDQGDLWIKVLVPLKDINGRSVIAVMEFNYSSDHWGDNAVARSLQSGVILLLLYLIIWGYYLAISRNKALKREKIILAEVDAKMKENIKLFRSVFNQAPIGIAIGDGEKYAVAEIEGLPGINPMFEKILGRRKEELAEVRWTEFTHPEDLEKDLYYFKSFQQGEIPGYSMVKRYIRPDGSFVWINMTIAELNLDNESENGNKHLCLIEDISERIRTEEALRESERSKAVLLSHLQGMAYRCSYDINWTMEFVSDGCYELTGYQPSSLLYNRDLSFNDLIAPEYREILWSEWIRILELRIPFRYEYEIISAANERKWVLELGQGIYDEDGKVEALEGIVIDISEGKKRAAQIQYMSDHDFMTGLYNRRFFEDMLEKYASQEDSLPLTIIVASINGMRLINDAFGHAEGDLLIIETAKIIQNCCRKGDIPARIGGDEFGILMPLADEEEAHLVMDKIEKVCDKHGRSNKNRLYDISLTTGYCVRKAITENVEAVLKAAEEYMYKRKLLNQKSSHSALLSSVMTTMYEKSQETEEHSERIAELSKTIGSRMQLPQKSLDDLQLLSMLHDIGKVGIDDRILKKPGKLNEEEWSVMKKHPEIGYRITMSSPELEHIAQYILSHHERWDGKGYPHGLKGEEIPLLSRILSLVDAYDAMTEDRVYRKALSREEALKEITVNSGTQFDPEIVKIFIEII